jgi:hypothetical protein
LCIYSKPIIMKNKLTKDYLIKIVNESLSIADVCRALNLVPVGGNYRTINVKLKLWNINTSHFTGRAWNTGDKFKAFGNVTPLSEILIENSTYTNTGNLKKKLIDEGYKKDCCEECSLDTWNGKKLMIELHHENGINSDHRIENLKMLCPNCHSQTKSYRGNNVSSARNKANRLKFDNRNKHGELVQLE